MRGTRGVLAATTVAAALLLGGGVALADEPPSPPAKVTSGPTPTSTAPSGDRVCTQRIPAVLARIDKITARINGDAQTRGSTAWLRARADAARASGHPALADLLDQQVGLRTQKLQNLANFTERLRDVQKKDCGA